MATPAVKSFFLKEDSKADAFLVILQNFSDLFFILLFSIYLTLT